MELSITELDLNGLVEDASILIVGKRRSGKSTWARYITTCLNMPRVVVFAGTKETQNAWRKVVPPLFVHGKSIRQLRAIKDYQERSVARYDGAAIPRSRKLLVVIDDCSSDRKFMNDELFLDLQSNSRHYGMCIITTAQSLAQIKSENRSQMDYVGMLFTSNLKTVEKIHAEYCNIVNKSTFIQIMRNCTRNKGLLWIDNTVAPESVVECCYYKQITDLNFEPGGASWFRTFSESHYYEGGCDPRPTITFQPKRKLD